MTNVFVDPTGKVLFSGGGAVYESPGASGYTGLLSISGTGFVNSVLNGGGSKILPRGVAFIGPSAAPLIGANGGLIASGGNWYGDTNAPYQWLQLPTLKSWHPNVVRMDPNEAGWNGHTCFDNSTNGDNVTGWHTATTHNLNCNGTLRAQFISMVADANSIGCYVIIPLAITNSGRSAPSVQDRMANQDNSIEFWQSMCDIFGYPNGTALKRNGGTVDDGSVIFELFNEPQDYGGGSTSAMQSIMAGTFFTNNTYGSGYPNWQQVWSYPCNVPSGPNGAGSEGQWFYPGELFSIGGVGFGRIHCYFLNTTTGLPSSGSTRIHVRQEIGSVSSGTTTTLTDTTRTGGYAWPTNFWVGATVSVSISGTAHTGTVTANTATQLTFSGGLTGGVTASGSYVINANISSIANGSTILGSKSSASTTTTSATYGWWSAGHSQMLAAIRAKGAWNPCMMSGSNYAGDLQFWKDYAPADTTPPAGWNAGVNGAWVPQIGAIWHVYPPVSYINSITVSSGGSGYAANDTLLLPMPQTGANAGGVYWQAKVQVDTVSSGAIVTCHLVSYTGGQPGIPGGNPQSLGYANVNNMVGGIYLNTLLPSNPVPADSNVIGTGSGASFNLGFHTVNPTPDFGIVPIIQAARNCPIWISETGDHSGANINPLVAPWASTIYAMANTYGVAITWESYQANNGWANPLGNENALIDGSHVAQPGFGTVVYGYLQADNP